MYIDLLTSAHQAARDGLICRLHEEDTDLIIFRSVDDDTLLGLACRSATGEIAIPPVEGTKEQHQAIDLLLRVGSDVNAANRDGWTPLHTAAMAGHIDLAKPLLGAGADKLKCRFMMNLQLPNPKLMDIPVPANQDCGNS